MHFSLDCWFGTNSLSLEEQIHAKLCHCSSVHLAEAGVGTEFHELLGVSILVWRSPQEHLDYCTQRSMAGRFCESKSPLHLLRSLVTAERCLVLSNWAFPNGLANPLGLEQLELWESDLEVSQLITNHYYLERKGILSVNRCNSAINHVARLREQSRGTLKRYSIDLSQSSGLQVTVGDV